jgi:hypothetical protein
MANAAFYQHFPLKQSGFIQNPKPTIEELKQKGYINNQGTVVKKTFYMFYMGDYDSSAWLYSQWKGFWDDKARGAVPIGWAINPSLIERFPLAYDYLFKTLSLNDRLIAGDSGAGYVNPTQFYSPRNPSHLPANPQLWGNRCQAYYGRFNITFTGFIIQGSSGPITTTAEELYVPFSPDGMVLQQGDAPSGKPPTHMVGKTPVFAETDIPRTVDEAVNAIMSQYAPGVTAFKVYRAILISPSFLLQVVNEVNTRSNGNMVVVEPLVLSLLAQTVLAE